MEGQLQDKCDFGIVMATIEAVDDTTVTFSTRSASKTGDPNECLLRSFTVPRTEIYAAPIAGAPAPVALKPGETGNLFLSSAGWQTRSSDGFTIHGVEHAVFKWPSCAAAPSRVLSALTIVPSSIVVQGHVENDTEFFELELLGPDAGDAQELAWNGSGFVELRLSPRGAGLLRLKSRSMVARVWPTRIVVQGSPAMDQAVAGAVNLLDLELAAEVQHLAYAKAGAPITLSLTQDGVNAFHVTPQAIADYMCSVGHASQSGTLPRQGQRGAPVG